MEALVTWSQSPAGRALEVTLLEVFGWQCYGPVLAVLLLLPACLPAFLLQMECLECHTGACLLPAGVHRCVLPGLPFCCLWRDHAAGGLLPLQRRLRYLSALQVPLLNYLPMSLEVAWRCRGV